MAAETEKPYERLPGTGYRRLAPGWAIILLFFVIGIFALLLRGRRVQLWLGRDHLLSVDWDGYREYYKRFRYQDIQVLMVRRTAEGRIVNLIVGLVVLVFAALALAVGNPTGTTILLIIASLFALILLGNVLSGPTCQCHLRTAVQTEELVSLGRLRHAQKVLDRVRPMIVAAQGGLAPEEFAARLQQELAVEASKRAYVVDDPNAPPRIRS